MLTDSQIQFLNRVCQKTWTECNNVINVTRNVSAAFMMKLTEIPVQFGRVDGDFNCNFN